MEDGVGDLGQKASLGVSGVRHGMGRGGCRADHPHHMFRGVLQCGWLWCKHTQHTQPPALPALPPQKQTALHSFMQHAPLQGLRNEVRKKYSKDAL